MPETTFEETFQAEDETESEFLIIATISTLKMKYKICGREEVSNLKFVQYHYSSRLYLLVM